MSNAAIICAYCGKEAMKETREINRAARGSAPLYCGRTCAGEARRTFKPDAQKRAEKAAYDAMYRLRDPEDRKRRRAEYHQRTYDPVKAAAERKLKMPRHVEYCRRPEYRKWKTDYDRKYCARKNYGPFAEAALVLRDLEAEIGTRATRTEIAIANGTLNKWTQRRRDYERQTDRR